MPFHPDQIWKRLPPELQRHISNELSSILQEVLVSSRSELVSPQHLQRKALIYIRQSTPHQVLSNQESLRLQYALHQRALDLGWRSDASSEAETSIPHGRNTTPPPSALPPAGILAALASNGGVSNP